MSDKKKVLETLSGTKVIAIIRGMEREVCVNLAKAYSAGGIRLVEVTFNQVGDLSATAAAISAIREECPDMCVGAGTVLTEEQLKMAIDAGAEFIVTPNTNPGVIRAAVASGLATFPGALTPTEIELAHEAGADCVKVFPARAMGPVYIKDVLAPLKHIRLLAVGGVTPDNARSFIDAGCVGVAVSGALTNREWIAAGAYDKITEVASRLIAACA